MSDRSKLAGAGAVLAAATATAMAVPAVAATPLSVHGTISGAYHRVQTNPDVGRAYRVSGHGHTSLGATKAAGRVAGTGNIQQGHCTARLVLTTTKGTLTVAVRSSKTFGAFAACQSGFAFAWHSVTASGGYAGRSGSGTGTLTLVKPSHASQSPPPFYVTFD
ncbi:MAG TPA: hypothetical protein VFT62_04305 [Mycobacteriales bacterium]|nr:hypothetical protein [Mycobacteriales bacterium]